MKRLTEEIQSALPWIWYRILRKNKCLTKFVKYTYKSLPDYMKGRGTIVVGTGNNKYKRRKCYLGLDRVKHLYKNAPIYCCMQQQYVEIDGMAFWSEIWRQIQELENNLK